MFKLRFSTISLLLVVAATTVALAAVFSLHRYHLYENAPNAALKQADSFAWKDP